MPVVKLGREASWLEEGPGIAAGVGLVVGFVLAITPAGTETPPDRPARYGPSAETGEVSSAGCRLNLISTRAQAGDSSRARTPALRIRTPI